MTISEQEQMEMIEGYIYTFESIFIPALETILNDIESNSKRIYEYLHDIEDGIDIDANKKEALGCLGNIYYALEDLSILGKHAESATMKELFAMRKHFLEV